MVHESVSLAQSLASLPPRQQAKALREAKLTDEEADALLRDWAFWARPSQRTPQGEWFVWLILAGRGWGKTRTGAEYIRDALLSNPGWRAALVAETIADARDTMVEGEESGLLALLRPCDLRGGSVETAWNRSLGELYFANGSKAKTFSAEKPGLLRGPQHHVAWCDEAAKWRDAPDGTVEDTTWSNLMFGLRLGTDPRCVVTTTPKPVKLLREIIASDSTHLTHGTTYENLPNLAAAFRANIMAKYEGTRLGRQELMAEMLEDVPGALWDRANLYETRVTEAPALRRIVVGVDPSVSSGEDSAECGIVVAGLGADGHGYVLDDRSRRDSPHGWATEAVTAYHAHSADRVVAEVNNGGELVELIVHTIDSNVAYKAVHAQKGKAARAEPIAALYEQRKVHHVGTFDELEDQLCSYTPGAQSPDRLDALVWALTELMLTGASVFDFYRKA